MLFAELVGVHDCIPMVLWVPLFMEALGYKVTDNIIYQDNRSAILLEDNEKQSLGKRTQAINIKYFMIRGQ